MKLRKCLWILPIALIAIVLLIAQVRYRIGRSVETEMEIPQLFQFDYTQSMGFYDGEEKSVATSGCGATCLSMVITYLTGNADQTPQTLFQTAVDSGAYNGDGLSHETLNALAESYNVKIEWIPNDSEAIYAAIRSGHPVIAHMGPGIFTQGGHYIVLRGLTKDGHVLVNDPNSRENSNQTFSMDTLLNQARNETAFGICSLAT